MAIEAMRWRDGIRSGEVVCRCKKIARPKDALGHIVKTDAMCIWEYAVERIYEIERQL